MNYPLVFLDSELTKKVRQEDIMCEAEGCDMV